MSSLLVLIVASATAGLSLLGRRVLRNRGLLQHLEKLPSADRLQALTLEMGATPLAAGLSPEQWLRNRLQQHVLIGAAMFFGAIVSIILISYQNRPSLPVGEITTDVGLYQEGSLVREDEEPDRADRVSRPNRAPVRDTADGSSTLGLQHRPRRRPPQPRAPLLASRTSSTGKATNGDAENALPLVAPDDLIVSYYETRTEKRSVVSYHLPYLDRVRSGEVVGGIAYDWTPFQAKFPNLSVKIVNNTAQTLFLTEAHFQVQASMVDKEPLLLVEDWSFMKLRIVNEGWGDVVDPRLTLSVTKLASCILSDSTSEPTELLALPRFDAESEVPILDYVPSGLRGERAVCVYGVLMYKNESGQARLFRFKTRVLLEVRAAANTPPSNFYHVFLTAGRFGYTEIVPIQQTVFAKLPDHFVFKLGTNRSASFDLHITLRATGEQTVPGGDVEVHVFSPRSQAGRTIKHDLRTRSDRVIEPQTSGRRGEHRFMRRWGLDPLR